MVFDDSSPATQQKYYSLLEQSHTRNELYYVGPREKEAFLQIVNRRLQDRRLEPLLRNLFRPSYGGNRNFTLIYTLGELLVSSDDDMRPHALIEDSPESLAELEISRGKLVKPGAPGFSQKSFDILASFRDVLGVQVRDLPGNFLLGDYVVDTAMDLETKRHARRHAPELAPTSSPAACRPARWSRSRRPSAPAPTTSTPSTSSISSSRTRTR